MRKLIRKMIIESMNNSPDFDYLIESLLEMGFSIEYIEDVGRVNIKNVTVFNSSVDKSKLAYLDLDNDIVASDGENFRINIQVHYRDNKVLLAILVQDDTGIDYQSELDEFVPADIQGFKLSSNDQVASFIEAIKNAIITIQNDITLKHIKFYSRDRTNRFLIKSLLDFE